MSTIQKIKEKFRVLVVDPFPEVEKFLKENINSLPVVDSDFIVTGIITHRDLIRWLLENQKFQK